MVTPLQSVPDFDKLEVVKVGVGATPVTTVTTVGAGYATTTQTNTYAHNLGFSPTPMAQFDDGTTITPLNYTKSLANLGVNNFYVVTTSVSADKTNVYIKITGTISTTGSGGVTFTSSPVKFYLLRLRGN